MSTETVKMVFMYTEAEGTKRTYRYGEVENGKITCERIYSNPLAIATPGTILEMDGERNGDKLTVHIKSIRYNGVWESDTDRLGWQAKSRSATMTVEGHKKMKDGDLVEKNVDALRTAYFQLPSSRRQAFVAWVLYKIIGG